MHSHGMRQILPLTPDIHSCYLTSRRRAVHRFNGGCLRHLEMFFKLGRTRREFGKLNSNLASTEAFGDLWQSNMAHWVLWLGLILLSPVVEVGGIVSIGTPFLLLGCYLRTLQFCKRDCQLPFGLIGICAAAYVICIFTSLAWSQQLFVAGFRAAYHVIGFVLFLGLLQRQNTQGDYKHLQFWVFALTSAGLAMALDFLILMGSLAVQGRLGEAFANRETGGVMSLKWAGSNTIASAILLSLHPAMMLSGNLGRFAKCAVGAMLLAILATLSRNSSICVLASVVVYACLSGRTVATIGAILAIAMVFGVGLWIVDADVVDFVMRSRVEGGNSATFNGRTSTWEDAWLEICRNWPCPVGFYGSNLVLGLTAHNLILTDTLELGVWGLGVHMMLFAGTAGLLLMARSRRRRAGQSVNDLNILLSGLLCILINLMFEDPQYTQPYIVCNWVFMGICVATARLPTDLKVYFAPGARGPSISAPRDRRGSRGPAKQAIGSVPGKRLPFQPTHASAFR